MVVRGRKRRTANFRERAKAFVADAEKGKGSRLAIRDKKGLDIGTGKHKRLVLKKSIGHVRRAKIDQARFIKFLKDSKIEPKNYSLVKVASHSMFGVQEYFHRPSLYSLSLFLEGKGKKLGFLEGKQDALLCKQFLGKHKDLKHADVMRASNELFRHLRQANILFQIEANIIVVGRARDGKLRLAMVDV